MDEIDSNVKTATLKNAQVYENVTDLINLVVDEIQKLNEVACSTPILQKR